MSFGTAIHDAIMCMEVAGDLATGLSRFDLLWDNPERFGIAYDYLIPRNSHAGYRDLAHKILRDWWMLIQWESDIVLAREHYFKVPIDGHELEGTADKVALRPQRDGSYSLLISDYKTSASPPTRNYLQHDVQFHAYCYASTQAEFWATITNGAQLFADFYDAPREAEWVHLRLTKRIPGGFRTAVHYERLRYAIEQIDQSIALGIFVPDMSGGKCEFCEFRKACGLPSRQEEGLE